MPRHAATTEFLVSLSEVEFLLGITVSHEAHFEGHAALLKSSLLLLAAKFENFLEIIVEECRYALEQRALKTSELPPMMVFAVIQHALRDDLLAQAQGQNPRCIERLKPLVPFLQESEIASIPIDTKLSFGKHGEETIRKLFRRLGIADIFVLITASSPDPETLRIADTADINSIVALRNNIIHGDASPVMTREQVMSYVEKLKDVAHRLDESVHAHCASIGSA